jgi:hypothetical protein
LCSAFVQVDEFEHGFNGSRRQANFGEAFVQALRASIAPAALGHETIPDFDLFFARAAAILKGPFEQFLVFFAFERFGFEGFVIDVEETAAARVEAGA